MILDINIKPAPAICLIMSKSIESAVEEKKW